MRILLGAFALLLPMSASAAELFRTNVGTGPYDSWKYGYYESATILKPQRTMHVTSVRPKIFSCLGECTYELKVSDRFGRTLTELIEKGARPEHFEGKLNTRLLLTEGMTYKLYTRIDSSVGEIGIYTAGSKHFPNRTGPIDLELIYARKGSKRYTERGPIAFTLEGEFAEPRRRIVKNRLQRMQERRAERQKRRLSRRHAEPS